MQYWFTSLNKYKPLSQHKIIKASLIAHTSHLEVRLSKSQFSDLVKHLCVQMHLHITTNITD